MYRAHFKCPPPHHHHPPPLVITLAVGNMLHVQHGAVTLQVPLLEGSHLLSERCLLLSSLQTVSKGLVTPTLKNMSSVFHFSAAPVLLQSTRLQCLGGRNRKREAKRERERKKGAEKSRGRLIDDGCGRSGIRLFTLM